MDGSCFGGLGCKLLKGSERYIFLVRDRHRRLGTNYGFLGEPSGFEVDLKVVVPFVIAEVAIDDAEVGAAIFGFDAEGSGLGVAFVDEAAATAGGGVPTGGALGFLMETGRPVGFGMEAPQGSWAGRMTWKRPGESPSTTAAAGVQRPFSGMQAKRAKEISEVTE